MFVLSSRAKGTVLISSCKPTGSTSTIRSKYNEHGSHLQNVVDPEDEYAGTFVSLLTLVADGHHIDNIILFLFVYYS